MMLASALETPAYAECRQAAVAACRVIPHGVVSVANGAYNIRITPFSRHRDAAICSPGPTRDCESPSPALDGKITSPGSIVRGRFTVCPLERVRPGRLPVTCLAGASRMTVDPHAP